MLKEMYIHHLSNIYILIIFIDIRKKQKANPMQKYFLIPHSCKLFI